jgi:hypothetical protein
MWRLFDLEKRFEFNLSIALCIIWGSLHGDGQAGY